LRCGGAQHNEKKIWGRKISPNYLGERVAKTTAAESILDNFYTLQAKITNRGSLLVPISRDTLMSLKTENEDVMNFKKKMKRTSLKS
jgi:hypothetical protein